MHGALKDFLPVVEQLTRLPGKLLARVAGLLGLVAAILGWSVARSSSGLFSWLPLVVGVASLLVAIFFGWRRLRLEKAVAQWMEDVVNTVDGQAEATAPDFSALYEGEETSDSRELIVIDEEGNPAPGGSGSFNESGQPTEAQLNADLAQRQLDAKMEASQPRDTWMPRVEAAQRAAVAAAGGIVNAPYLKDDLRVTIASAILAALAVPLSMFFIFVAFFSLL